MNETKKKSVAELSDSFVKSKWSLIILISILMLVATLQIILFVATDHTMSGFGSEDTLAWVTWTYLLVSFPFGICCVASMVLSIRGNKNYFWYNLGVEFGYCVSGVAAGMMSSTMVMLILVFVNTYRFIRIKNDGENYDINAKMVNIFLVASLIVFAIVGVLSIELDKNNVFWWNTNVYEGSKLPLYLDVFTGLFTLAGGILMVSRNKYGFIAFILCDFLFLLLFINAHQWSNVSVTLIFLIIEFLGFMSWGHKE